MVSKAYRVVFSGGGTGGHVYPALSIAQEFKARHQSMQALFVGANRGIERDLVPGAGFELKSLDLTYLPRRLSLAQATAVLKAYRGLRAARAILKEFSPDVVVGTGGYVAGPVLLAAALGGYKTLIHEQNAFPSLTNRVLGRLVDRVAVSHSQATGFFPIGKVVVTGNPLRKDILAVDRDVSRAALGLREHDLMVLAVGGSGGALKVNESLWRSYSRLIALGYTVYHITGKNYYSMVKEHAVSVASDRLNVLAYSNEMPTLMAAADLVVSRAGSITAEMAFLGKPAILIPSPIAANDHQTYNARVAQSAGAAALLKEEFLTAEVLVDLIQEILSDPTRRKKMAEAFTTLAYPNATGHICDLMEDLTGGQ